MMVSNRAMRALTVLLFVGGPFALPAAAQTYGAQVGISRDPEQFYLGAHAETPPLVNRVNFRPNIEVGLGDDRTHTSLNFEFIYRFLGDYSWKLFGGGGPALNIIRISDSGGSATEGGFNFVVGVAHDGGLFVEVKAGAMDSPGFKLGVGYTFR
jgi:hypothetical protein